MTNDTQLLHQCLEAVATANVDISSSVYAEFSASMPESDQYLASMDERMKGRMLGQIYEVLLGETDDEYVQFEARTHREYGANESFYRGLLTAVKDSVRAIMGHQWSAAHEAAWDRSIERIVAEFKREK